MKRLLVFAVCAMQGLVALAGPYAFTYGGRAVTGLDTAPVVSTVEDGAGRFTRTVREWTSPDGKMLLRSTETEYRDYPVREYVPELVCVGDAPTEIVDGSGVEVAIGWSGAWRGDFALDQNCLTASAGMVRTHFRLLPGETIRQPSVLVFTRGKDVSPRAFQTVIHRHMLK